MKGALSTIVGSALAGITFVSCRQAVEPGLPAQIPIGALVPFPDSINRANPLPPRTDDSSTVVLGDTLAVGQVGNGGTQISVRFFARDTASGVFHPRTLPLAECPFVVALTRLAETAAVWRSDRAAPALRCPSLQRSLDGAEVDATYDVKSLLGDSIAAGKYRAPLDVHAADGRVFHYSSITMYLTPTIEPSLLDYSLLEFKGSSAITGVAPRYLNTSVVVRNPTAKPFAVDYGACAVNVRLFKNADRTGNPVWRSEDRRAPGSPYTYGCITPLYVSTVPPGDSLVFPMNVPMYEVIGDSLPAGHYYVSAELGLVGQTRADGTPAPGLTRSVAAGEVDIANERDRLPASRVADSVSFTATTRVIPGNGDDTLRTLVMVTNVSTRRVTMSIAASCQVIAYVYRTADLRDSVPIAQPMTTFPSSRCVADNYPFALDAGRSWVFGTQTPMSVIRARFGVGHYWFTAWLLTTGQILLAAGDAEVK